MSPGPGIRLQAEVAAGGLPPLLVAAERVAAAVSQGVHGRRRVGQGETFWQFRRYQWGDPVSRIDWRQSAKSVPVYVRENEWEAAQSVWLWRDASPSMHYRAATSRPEKVARANLLLLALASLLVRGGEHVTLLGSGLPPRGGRMGLNRLATTVEEDGDATDSLPRFEPLPRYAHVVWLGDLLAPLDEVKAAVDRFAGRGVRGHLMQVLDPAEESLPFAGRVHFEGTESEGDVIIGRVESVREDYRDLMARHREGLKAIARSAGWTFDFHHTDESAQRALLALFVTMSLPRGVEA